MVVPVISLVAVGGREAEEVERGQNYTLNPEEWSLDGEQSTHLFLGLQTVSLNSQFSNA
jgi:hypothetical protein